MSVSLVPVASFAPVHPFAEKIPGERSLVLLKKHENHLLMLGLLLTNIPFISTVVACFS